MTSGLQKLDTDGYAVIPDFLDKQTTARIREHMDSLMPPITPLEDAEAQRIHQLRHPIPGAIMAEILNRKPLLDLAKEILFSNELRLLEQVLIRTDPRPARPEDKGPTRAIGWHIDQAFLPKHYDARPRQTYFHMVHALNTVPEGGGGTTLVPGSHHKTFAAAEKLKDEAALESLRRDPVQVAEIDLSEAVELHPQEGELLVFNPMCLHSASANIADAPRYVYFASFYDVSAEYLQSYLKGISYSKGYPPSLRENLPSELHILLS